MKFYLYTPKALLPYFNKELSAYKQSLDKGYLHQAWYHLERAHILGQRYPFAHNKVHWLMLKFGIKIKSTKEIKGQILRLIFGGVKSFVGIVPVGNPGGANVPPLKSFDIDEGLKNVFKKAGIKN